MTSDERATDALNDRTDAIDRAVATTDPYPARVVDQLPLDVDAAALLAEIAGPPAGPRSRRTAHGAWRPVLAAAAAVAVLASVGLLVRGLTGGEAPEPPASAPTSAPTPAESQTAESPEPTLTPVDPGLPPTAENLFHVLLQADGWRVRHLSNSAEWGGSVAWTDGEQTLEMTWYPADQYQAYLQDRRRIGRTRAVEVLGQRGEAVTETMPAEPEGGSETLLDGPGANPMAPTPAAGGGATEMVSRTMAILPPVGEWFLEFDAFQHEGLLFEDLAATLTRVGRGAWLADLEAAVVTPSEGEEFLRESLRGVPVPPGLGVGLADLDLPQDSYQARVAVVRTVACEWAQRHASGDPDALPALQTTRDWPVLKAMVVDGDYPEVLWGIVDRLAQDPDTEYAAALGC